MNNFEAKGAEQGIQAIDAISMVYRYMILYRLNKKKASISKDGDPEKLQYETNTQEAYKLLNIAVAHLTQMTEVS